MFNKYCVDTAARVINFPWGECKSPKREIVHKKYAGLEAGLGSESEEVIPGRKSDADTSLIYQMSGWKNSNLEW